MHPKILQDNPGICIECGMKLVPSRSKSGKFRNGRNENEYDKHAGHSTQTFLQKFWVVLALTIPIVAYSEIAEKLFAWRAPRFVGDDYIILVLASIVFFYGGWVFIAGAYKEVRAKLPGMMTLITIAITAAYFFSIFSVFASRGETLFWELSTLITIMLGGHWLEMKAVGGAQSALRELAKFLPDTAEVIRNGTTQTILISELIIADIVLIRPGSKVPADGLIIDGQSDVNESIITGESKPVSKKVGDSVIAGSLNGDGSLRVRVDKIGDATFLAGVMRLVVQAQASKSRLQILSDRAAFYLTIIALTTGVLTFVIWLAVQAGAVKATEHLVAVLIIACPHALGLAVPLVASISTTKAARAGLLIRQRLSLETARKIDTVLFDKTGTLTKGEFGVSAILPTNNTDSKELIAIAGSVSLQSEHLLSKAMVQEAQKQNVTLREVKNFERIAGKGARAFVQGQLTHIGNAALMQDLGIKIAHDFKSKIDVLSKEGQTLTFIVLGEKLLGVIAMVDVIREESHEAIKALRKAGIRTALITGDSEDVARWVATQLNIDEYYAKVLPQEKSEKVKALQQKGYKVAMVGDGVNDAPALAQADLGIAIGAGTNVAIESAGIILVKNDPRDIPKIIKLSRITYIKMLQNLFWAAGYNIVALPLAAGALSAQGVILTPAVAAALMSVSTVIVAANAMLLRRQKI